MTTRLSDSDVVRPAVRQTPARHFPPLAEQIGAGSRPIRSLALNESAYPPSPKVVEAVAQAMANGNFYPDPLCKRLAARLAERVGVAAERMVFGNGSDELIGLIGETCLDSAREAVMPAPSFPSYALATRKAGGRGIAVPLRPDGSNDVAALLAALTPATRVLFASTVNNPSGGPLTRDDLATLCCDCPADVLLVLDDAYFEFGRAAGGPDALEAVAERTGPWAVLRTFSKAHALAGLRIGYALCSDADVAVNVLKRKATFNINALAQCAALASLDDSAYWQGRVAACAQERERLAAAVSEMGLEVMPSAANFLSFRLPMPATEAAAALLADGYMVRPWTEPGYEQWLRVTIGLPEDTDGIVASLSGLLERVAIA